MQGPETRASLIVRLQNPREDAADASEQDQRAWEKIKSQLTAAVERALNLRLEMQLAQIDLVEQKLNETRKQLDQRKQDVPVIIRRRVEELTHSKDLSWLGAATSQPLASAVTSPDNTESAPSLDDLPVYPRNAVNIFMAAARKLNSQKAASAASEELAEKSSLQRWNDFLKDRPHYVQHVRIDMQTTHAGVMMNVGGERVLFELERLSNGEWQLVAINRLEKIVPLNQQP